MTKKILAIVTTVFGVILGVVASLSGSTVETHAAYPTLTTGTIIELEPRSNYGSRISVCDSASQTKSNVQVEVSALSKPQRFLVNNDGNGIELVPICNSLMALTTEGTANGSNVVTTFRNGSEAQRWAFERQGNGSYLIRSKQNSSTMLDVNSSGNLQVWASRTVKNNNTYNVHIVSTPKPCYRVNTASAGHINLNIRESAGSWSRKIGEKSHGTILDIDYVTNGWCHLVSGGFVSAQYVETIEMPAMNIDTVCPVSVYSQIQGDGCGDASACTVLDYLGAPISEKAFRQKYMTSYHGYVFKIREGINTHLAATVYKEININNKEAADILGYISQSLVAGKPVILNIKGNVQGVYQTNGHYVVAYGVRYDTETRILIADPFTSSASFGWGGAYRDLSLDELSTLIKAGNNFIIAGTEVN